MMKSDMPIAVPLAAHLLRFSWLVIGNAIVYAAGVGIVLTSAPLPSGLDAVMWSGVVYIIFARRFEITRYARRTMHGEPATLDDWRRFMLILIGSVAVGAFLAHYLGGSLTS